MTIQQNKTGSVVNLLTVTTNFFNLLSTFVDNKCTVTVSYNCGESFSRNITTSSVVGNTYVITPLFIGNTSFKDGVYKIILSGKTSTNTITETACTFVDQKIKCLVADYLADKKTNYVLAGILYYTLSKAQDCNCECDNLCKLFCELTSLIDGHECNC